VKYRPMASAPGSWGISLDANQDTYLDVWAALFGQVILFRNTHAGPLQVGHQITVY
jgi:hypothetical protein